jgi:hypothetical protein
VIDIKAYDGSENNPEIEGGYNNVFYITTEDNENKFDFLQENYSLSKETKKNLNIRVKPMKFQIFMVEIR